MAVSSPRLQAVEPHFDRTVLYFAPTTAHAERFFEALKEAPGCTWAAVPGGYLVRFSGLEIHFVVRHSPEKAHEALGHHFFNLVLIDLRGGAGTAARLREDFRKTLRLLDTMDEEPDVEQRYGFHRILAVLSGPDPDEVDRMLASLAARGVGRVMRDTSTCPFETGCPRLPNEKTFGRTVLDEVARLTARRQAGKVALCASGGGITGIYYEMGALKCLEDCLSPGAINSFDMYFGISAGAVVTGVLANGYTIDEFMASIAGEGGSRVPSVSLSLLRMGHLNLASLSAPFEKLLGGLWSSLGEVLHWKSPISLETLFLEYNNLLTAPFRADGFEKVLRRLFTAPGAKNDFRKLPHRLYIGATDQDARQHVLFGEPPFEKISISAAIQASISLNPAFASTKIGDRYYVDGAVTRTSDFSEAIKKGATLIFALDPLVPYVSKRPGFAKDRGILYNADQDIRTVSFTRFETTRAFMLRKYPEVSLYTFLPANRLRRVMSVNPMDHRPYLQIWRGAYLSTLQRVLLLKHRMAGDLVAHGLVLDTTRAEEVAARLESVLQPSLADFFPGGKLVIRSRRRKAPAAAGTKARKGRRRVADAA